MPNSQESSPSSNTQRATNKPGRPRRLAAIEQGQKTLPMQVEVSHILTRSVSELVKEVATQDQVREVEIGESTQEEEL